MRKLVAILICPLLILVANGCTGEATPPPSKAEASEPTAATTKKGTPKRRPKLEAVSKQDKTTKPFSD
jgi:hypothetical protein